MARDPSGMVDGPNLYAFVGNRPTYAFDGWGMEMGPGGQFDFGQFTVTGSKDEARIYHLTYMAPEQQLALLGGGFITFAAADGEAAAGLILAENPVGATVVVGLGGYAIYRILKNLPYDVMNALFALDSANNSKANDAKANVVAVTTAAAATGAPTPPDPDPNKKRTRPTQQDKQFGTRHEAFREAKDAAGIPRTQQASRVYTERLYDQPGNVQSRVYEFTRSDGSMVTIREHSLGHLKGDLGPHFNVEIRPPGGGPSQPLPGGGDGHFFFP